MLLSNLLEDLSSFEIKEKPYKIKTDKPTKTTVFADVHRLSITVP